MPWTCSHYILLQLIVACTTALPWNGPNETVVGAEIAGVGWTPKPTQAAMLKDALFGNFGKRQMGYHICGYQDGILASSFTCDTAYVCATDAYYGAAGCCDPQSLAQCDLNTSCYPSAAVSKSCNASCQGNDRNAVCTASNATFCYTVQHVYGTATLSNIGCTDTASILWTVYETYSGETSTPPDPIASVAPPPTALLSSSSKALTAIPIIPLPSPTVSGTTSHKAAGSLATSATASTPPTSASTPPISTSTSLISTTTPPISTSTPPTLSSPTASPSPILPPNSSSSTNSTANIGAIVGGVLGGVAVLGVIAATIIFILLRDKRHRAMAANQDTTVPNSSDSQGPSELEHKSFMNEAAEGERFEAPDGVRVTELPAE